MWPPSWSQPQRPLGWSAFLSLVPTSFCTLSKKEAGDGLASSHSLPSCFTKEITAIWNGPLIPTPEVYLHILQSSFPLIFSLRKKHMDLPWQPLELWGPSSTHKTLCHLPSYILPLPSSLFRHILLLRPTLSCPWVPKPLSSHHPASSLLSLSPHNKN